MEIKTKNWIIKVVGLVLVPILSFTLFLGAQTYDGGLLGKFLIVVGPMAIYAVGLYLLLAGLADRSEDGTTPSS